MMYLSVGLSFCHSVWHDRVPREIV